MCFVISFLLGAVMFGATSFLPLFLQTVTGASATNSGLLIVPLMAGSDDRPRSSPAGGSAPPGRYRIYPIIGTLLCAGGVALLSQMGTDTTRLYSSVSMAIVGYGVGMTMPTLSLAAQNAVSGRDLGVVTSATTFFRSLGGALGVALFGAVLNARTNADLDRRLPAGTRHRSRAPCSAARREIRALPAELSGPVIHAVAEGVTAAFLVAVPVVASRSASPGCCARCRSVPRAGWRAPRHPAGARRWARSGSTEITEAPVAPGWAEQIARQRAGFAPLIVDPSDAVLEGVELQADELGGVPVEWTVPAGGPSDDGLVILYLHGGGYSSGPRGVGPPRPPRAWPAARAVAWWRADYRLAPRFPFPAAHEDVLAVYRAPDRRPAGSPRPGSRSPATRPAARSRSRCMADARGRGHPDAGVRDAQLAVGRHRPQHAVARRPRAQRLRHPPRARRALSATLLSTGGDRPSRPAPLARCTATCAACRRCWSRPPGATCATTTASRLAASARAAGVDVTITEYPDAEHIWILNGPWRIRYGGERYPEDGVEWVDSGAEPPEAVTAVEEMCRVRPGARPLTRQQLVRPSVRPSVRPVRTTSAGSKHASASRWSTPAPWSTSTDVPAPCSTWWTSTSPTCRRPTPPTSTQPAGRRTADGAARPVACRTRTGSVRVRAGAWGRMPHTDGVGPCARRGVGTHVAHGRGRSVCEPGRAYDTMPRRPPEQTGRVTSPPLVPPETLAMVGEPLGEPVSALITRREAQRYARAVGDLDPIYFDEAAARDAGYDGLVAPPTFVGHAVVEGATLDDLRE